MDISEMYFKQFFPEDYINVCNEKSYLDSHSVRAITISGDSMTPSKRASGADLEETHLLLFFEL